MLALVAGMYCAMAWNGVMAQTINQPTFSTSGIGDEVGQSFEATLTGEIVAISVGSLTARNANLYIYNGPSGSGIAGSVGTPIYTQAISLNASALGVLQRIDLNTAFPITAGSSYTFIISGPGEYSIQALNPYANGEIKFDFANPFGGVDLTFAVFEQALAAPVAVTPAAIPSSSTWSLIGAGVFIMAAVLVQRRRSGVRQRR